MSRAKFRWRRRIRRHLPWFLIDRGFANKGLTDCGAHEWYNSDYIWEHCYNCEFGVRRYDAAHFG